jgi:hypothetical protein
MDSNFQNMKGGKIALAFATEINEANQDLPVSRFGGFSHFNWPKPSRGPESKLAWRRGVA